MAVSRLERLAPLSGIAFVVLTAVGIVISWADSPEDFPGKTPDIVEYFTEQSGSIVAGAWIGLVGAFFLLWFAGSLRSRLRLAEGADGRLSSIAFGGAVAAATILMVMNAAYAIAALRVEEHDEISPDTATALYDLANGLVGAALPVALAVLVGATGVLALRTGALPRWLGILSLVIMVGLLILPIAWILNLAALIWVLVVSVMLYLRPGVEAGVAATEPPPARTTPG